MSMPYLHNAILQMKKSRVWGFVPIATMAGAPEIKFYLLIDTEKLKLDKIPGKEVSPISVHLPFSIF